MSAYRTSVKEQRCSACAAKHKPDLYKALFDDIRFAHARGNAGLIRDLFNRLTNNNITTCWNFVYGNEVISL